MNLMDLFIKIGVDDQASSKIDKITGAVGNGLATAAKVGTAAIGVAAAGITALTKASIDQFAEYEQLAGGAKKIFDQMDYSKIAEDAGNAYKELGLSANQYLTVINDVGATFAATMGDEAGYEAAKTGLKAISDYASGTGKNVNELSQKFTLITRSTASYQSIADQFSGILPATSAGFLEQAQAAGILSDSYTQLTQVPIDEYQAAVSQMLQQGVDDLGLANNTANEAFSTLSGSLSMTKAAWQNLVTGMSDESANLDALFTNLVESVEAVAKNLIPKVEVALVSIASLIEKLAPVIVESLPALVEKLVPSLIKTATDMVNAVIAVVPDLLNTFVTALVDNAPALITAAIGLAQSLIQGIQDNYQILMDGAIQIVKQLATGILNMLPQIVQLGLDLIVSLANGIAESLPTLIPTIIDVVLQIVDTLTNPEQLSNFLDAALVLLTELAYGLMDAIPTLVNATLTIIESLVAFLTNPENIGKLLLAAVEIMLALATGIVNAIPRLLEYFSKVPAEMIKNFTETDWGKLGEDVVNGLLNGLKRMWGSLTKWFSDAWSDLVGGVKDFLGIHSPSRVFAEIGGNMALGVGKGWGNEYGEIQREITDSLNFETGSVSMGTFNSFANKSGGQSGFPTNPSGDIVINLTTELGGAAIARKQYRYNMAEAQRHGKSLVNR